MGALGIMYGWPHTLASKSACQCTFPVGNCIPSILSNVLGVLPFAFRIPLASTATPRPRIKTIRIGIFHFVKMGLGCLSAGIVSGCLAFRCMESASALENDFWHLSQLFSSLIFECSQIVQRENEQDDAGKCNVCSIGG